MSPTKSNVPQGTLKRKLFSSLVLITVFGGSMAAFLIASGSRALAGESGALEESPPAKGAYTCDLFVDPALLGDPTAVAKIDRDRTYMTDRPGLLIKYQPVLFNPLDPGTVIAGGRYLFKTVAHAVGFDLWLRFRFFLDGALFFERSYFQGADCHIWYVVGVRNFTEDPLEQSLLRIERYKLTRFLHPGELQDLRSALEDEAEQRGLTGVWFLYNPLRRLVQIHHLANRLTPLESGELDIPGLVALSSQPPLGSVIADSSWTSELDLTYFVHLIGFPFVLGDRGEPTVWPNSPPLPEPHENDGSCQPARGETSETAPNDCLPTCGNAMEDPGETPDNCPADVRPAFPWMFPEG